MKQFFLALVLSFNVHAQDPGSVELAPVIVTTDIDKQGAPLVIAPGSFLKRDREALEAQTPDSLKSSLGAEPNVDFTGGTRAQVQAPQIRGLGSERILILENGVRQNFQTQHSGRVFGDYSLMENFEVVKGPWSSLYGSGAMGGVVSFRRSRASDLIRRYKVNRGVQLALDATSASESFGQRATAFTKSGMFEPLVSFRHNQAGDIRKGDGEHIKYSKHESRDFYGSLGVDLGQTHALNLTVNRFVDRSRMPLDPEAVTSTPSLLGQFEMTKEDVVGDYAIVRGNLLDFHAKPYVRETKVSKSRLTDGRTDTQTTLTTGIDVWNNFRTPLSSNVAITTTIGAEYFKDQNDGDRNGGKLDSFPDGFGEQSGFYLQPSFKIDTVTLTPGVRFDSYKLEDSTGAAANAKDEEVSLKAYASWEFKPEKMIFAAWSQAFNAPRLQDLYISGQHFPGNFFVANPDLKAERAEQFEIGSKNQFKLNAENLVQANVTYFRTEARDFINRSVDIVGGTTRFENLDKVSLEGFEATSSWISGVIGLGLSYGQTRSVNKATGESLADTSPDQWTGKLMYFANDNLTLGIDVTAAETQERVIAGAQKTPGYMVGDLHAKFNRGPLETTFRINNVLDHNYRRHNSGIGDVGRDVRVNLAYLF